MTPDTKAVLAVAEEHNRRAAEFCRRHRDFTTTEAMDDLAAEFEKLSREVRNKALKDAVEWVENVGHRLPREHAHVAFHCVNVINTRSKDRPDA